MHIKALFFSFFLLLISFSSSANNLPSSLPADSTFYLEWGPVVMDFKRVNTDVSTAIFVTSLEVAKQMLLTPPSVKTEYANVPPNISFELSCTRDRQTIATQSFTHTTKNKALQEPLSIQMKSLSIILQPGDQLIINKFQTAGITFAKKIIINIKGAKTDQPNTPATAFSCALKWGDKTFQFLPLAGADTITWYKAIGINGTDLPANANILQFVYLNNSIEVQSASIGIVSDAEEKLIQIADWKKEGIQVFNSLARQLKEYKDMSSVYFRINATTGESYTGALSVTGEGTLILPSDTAIAALYKPVSFNNNNLLFRKPDYRFKIGKFTSPVKVTGYVNLYNPVVPVTFNDVLSMMDYPVELFYKEEPIVITKYDFLRTRVLGNPKVFGINNDNTPVKETALIPKLVESLKEGDAITFKRLRTANGIPDYFATFKVKGQ